MEEEELLKLYEQYSQSGFSQNKAFRLMTGAGYDTPEARTYMASLYTDGPKKKSQDASQAVSSTEEVSTESTSATPQVQQPESGDLDSPVTSFDLAIEDLFPGGLNVAPAQADGPPNRYRATAGGAYRINPTPLANAEQDYELDRILRSMGADTFHQFAMASARPVQALGQQGADELYKGFLPEGLLGDIIRPGEATVNRYGEVLDRLAMAYVLDERTQKAVEGGMDMERALLENKDWMKKFVKFSEDDFTDRGPNPYNIGMKRDLFNREMKKVEKEVDAKRRELEVDYVNNYYGKSFVDALPVEYNEKIEDPEGKQVLTNASRSKLASLEKQFKRRTGYAIDFSGDNKVGNRPLFQVKPGFRGTIKFEGEAVDKLTNSSVSVLDGMTYLLSRLGGGMLGATETYTDENGNVVNVGELMMSEVDLHLKRSEEEMQELNEKMNEYQLNVSSSLANGDFASAMEQSFLMTAESAPYLAPMLLTKKLGITGSAAMSTFLGLGVEANLIKEDKTFDTFVKDGKKYNYYEAAKEAGTYDMTELEKQFEIETDYFKRWGFLGSVAAADFGVNLSLNRALMGSYKKGMKLEAESWFKGWAYGQRTALGESAMATATSMFIRNCDEALKGGNIDFEQAASDAIEMTISTAPLTMLLHTAGSAARSIRGTAATPQTVPLNAEEMGALNRQVLEYQRKVSKSRDPRFIAEANQFILNNRRKVADLRQGNVDYLTYLHEKDPSAFLEVSNASLTLERLKLNYKNTNDPNLKLQYKENATALLSRLDEIYGSNKAEFEKFQGTIRGVREREEERADPNQVGGPRTRQQDQRVLDELTTPQQRTDTDLIPIKPEPDPTLSPYAKMNDRMAGLRRIGQKAREKFNQFFRSSGGIGNKNIEEVVRSKQRLDSGWIDEVQFDARLWRQLLKQVRRPEGLAGRKRSKAEMQVTQEAMYDVLTGKAKMEDARLMDLTPQQKDQLQYFRSHVDSLSSQLIKTLQDAPAGSPESMKARQELIEKIQRNKGAYLTQSYELFMDGDKRLDLLLGHKKDMPANIRKAYDDAVEFIADQFDNDITSDTPLTRQQRLQLADQKLGQYLQRLKGGKEGTSFGILGAIDAPFLRAKKNDLAQPIQQLLGKIQDPMNAYLTTTSKLNSYLANTRWQTELSMVLKESGISRLGQEFSGMTSDMGRMVPLVPDGDRWLPLTQTFVPEGFKTAFDNLMPLKSIDNDIMKFAVSVTSAVKVGKTVFSPTTTSRNLVSGTFLAMANGHLPVNPANLGKTMDAVTQAWGASAKRGIKGKGKYADSVWRAERKKLIEMGILNDGANSGELMAFINDSMGGDIKRILKGKGRTGIKDFSQKLYAFGDDFYKVNGYYQERKAFVDSGMSVAEAEAQAAARVRGGYPTYSYISKGAKQLRRFPAAGSFVSFPYEMYRTTANQFRFMAEDYQAGRTGMAMRRAMGLLTSGVTGYALSEYSMDKLGMTDQEDQAIRALGPGWQKLSQLVYLGTEDGSPMFMDASYALPHEVVMKPIRALFGSNPDDKDLMDNMMTAVGEVVKPFIDQDVTTRFVSGLVGNRNENGREIISLSPTEKKQGFGGLFSACMDDSARGTRNCYNVLAHFIKGAAPGVAINAAEFLRAGAIEETYELLKGEELPNGHPLEEAQDAFQDYFPQKTSYKEYTIRDAVYAFFGARVSYMPLDVAGANSIREWDSHAQDEMNEVWHLTMPQPELTMPGEIDERAAEYIYQNNEAQNNIQRTVDLVTTLDMELKDIVKMLDRGGIPEKEMGFYLTDRYVFPPLISQEQVQNHIESQTWTKGITTEERIEIIKAGWRNAGQFNRAVANGYKETLRDAGLSESEIENKLKEMRDGLGETNYED